MVGGEAEDGEEDGGAEKHVGDVVWVESLVVVEDVWWLVVKVLMMMVVVDV